MLTTVPPGVPTVIRPEPVTVGTAVVRLVVVAADALAPPRLNVRRSLAGSVSKFVPLTVTLAPATPTVGVKDAIVGAPVTAPTVNALALVAEPPGAMRWMVPVVAPAGTVATSCVAVADETVAAVPVKVTASWLVVVEKPVPAMVTVAPTAPPLGENVMIETVDELYRPIDRMFPTAS